MREMRRAKLPVILVAGMACWCAAIGTAGYAQEKTLWQIGTFDQSSDEFGLSFGFGALSGTQPDPVYRVGQSDWKKDWFGFQPGSANGRTGGREHPFTVIFFLDEPPRGLYTLTVALLPYMPLSVASQKIAMGLNNEPVPRGKRSGAATTMNSQRFSSSQTLTNSSNCRLSAQAIPMAAI